MSKSGGDPCSNLFPWNGFCFAGVQVRDTAGDLLVPSVLDTLVYGGVEAIKKRAGQSRTLLVGQRKRLLEQLESLASHKVIIPLARTLGTPNDVRPESDVAKNGCCAEKLRGGMELGDEFD